MNNNTKILKICAHCISDESVPGISFDDQGICNYCRIHEQLDKEFPLGEEGQKIFSQIVQKIKKEGECNKKYDCVIGVSGGCDSSFLLYKVKEAGLRPLAVHFDNTWNSEVATQNIQKLLKKLDVDLYTYVVDNEEYDDIYRSFFKSGVKDIESPTDIGLISVLYRAAEQSGVKYILDGHSFRTEGIVPNGWSYMDGKYIESIQKQFGTKKLKTFPNLRLSDWMKWMIVKKIKRVRPLYYIDYQKEEAKKILNQKFGWEWYGGKHLENRFTAFFMSYFLPVRFGINYPILELSGLIRSGQVDRESALKKLKELEQTDTRELVELVKKRLGFSNEEFDCLMRLPLKNFQDYKTYKPFFKRFRIFFWLLYKLNYVPQSFYMKYTR